MPVPTPVLLFVAAVSLWFSVVTLKAFIHKADEGGYWAEVPALPGCVTQAETLDELEVNICEAIEGWLAVEDPTDAEADQVIEVAV